MSTRSSRAVSALDGEPPKPGYNPAVHWQQVYWEHDQNRWNTAKIWLRSLAISVGVFLLGLSIWTVIGGPTRYTSGGVPGLPLAIIMLAYNIGVFVVNRLRGRKDGVPAAVATGFELLLWLVGVAMTGLLIRWTLDLERVVYSNAPLPVWYRSGQLWYGVSCTTSALAMLLTALHLVLFTRSCVEVDRQRKTKRQQKQQAPAREVDSSGVSILPAHSSYGGSSRQRELEGQTILKEKVLSNEAPVAPSAKGGSEYSPEPKSLDY